MRRHVLELAAFEHLDDLLAVDGERVARVDGDHARTRVRVDQVVAVPAQMMDRQSIM